MGLQLLLPPMASHGPNIHLRNAASALGWAYCVAAAAAADGFFLYGVVPHSMLV